MTVITLSKANLTKPSKTKVNKTIMGNSPTKPTHQFDASHCVCRSTEFKYKWCQCGRSKPSNEPPTKVRFWIDSDKIRNGVQYNVLEIPEHAKTDKDRDPQYQALVRELQGYSKQIYRGSKQ